MRNRDRLIQRRLAAYQDAINCGFTRKEALAEAKRLTSRTIDPLTKWTYVGALRDVYVRGDKDRGARTGYVEVARKAVDGKYRWELLTSPLGELTGWGAHADLVGAKIEATKALKAYIRRLA